MEVVVLLIGAWLLYHAVRDVRGRAWTGPRTPAMRSRAAAPRRPRAPGGGRTAIRSAGAAVTHPGSGAIRAQAKADTRRAWQETFAADWIEQRRHDRQNGTGSGTATAAPANGTQPAAQGNGGPPARQSPPPPAPPRPARPAGSNGGTPVAAGTSTASAEKLIEGINEIHAHAAAGGIHAKREALAAMHEGAVRFAAMAQMVARTMSEPGSNYGNEITEPIAKGGQQFQAGAITIGEAEASLATLVNMTVGDLATSARQAPHHRELSENGSH